MDRIDSLLSHVWMVRTFLKHAPETEDEPELRDVVRQLYDYSLALGEPHQRHDAEAYLRQARRKLAKLRQTAADFAELQPEISTHTNFQMAARSLAAAVAEIGRLLEAGGS